TALNVLHDDEVHAIIEREVMDRTDVRMVQGGGEPGLALETLQVNFVLGQFRWENFEDDSAAQRGIDGLVNGTLTAGPNLRHDSVMEKTLPNHKEVLIARK